MIIVSEVKMLIADYATHFRLKMSPPLICSLFKRAFLVTARNCTAKKITTNAHRLACTCNIFGTGTAYQWIALRRTYCYLNANDELNSHTHQ